VSKFVHSYLSVPKKAFSLSLFIVKTLTGYDLTTNYVAPLRLYHLTAARTIDAFTNGRFLKEIINIDQWPVCILLVLCSSQVAIQKVL
jgi:hypothetical protein